MKHIQAPFQFYFLHKCSNFIICQQHSESLTALAVGLKHKIKICSKPTTTKKLLKKKPCLYILKIYLTSQSLTDPLSSLLCLTSPARLSPIDLYQTDRWCSAPLPVGTCDISQIPLINYNVYFAISLPVFPAIILNWKITHRDSTRLYF